MLDNFLGKQLKALTSPHFPTRQQAFVWRNWEMVPICRLAETLETTEQNILALANDMGLRLPPKVNEQWLIRGYITILRRNWHILPYEQLLLLLGWSEKKLAHTLKEEDFLYHKLGDLKPDCKLLHYTPLNQTQIEQTLTLKETMEKHFPESDRVEKELPFAFLKEFQNPPKIELLPCREKMPHDIVINKNWTILFPKGKKYTKTFAERFVATHAGRWGENLQVSNSMQNVSSIELAIKPEFDKNAESHSISITENKIKIISVDEVGLLRGLQWLEKEMEANGGPYLQKGVYNRITQFNLRLLYSYFAVYGDPLLNPELNPYPDSLLAKYSALGINGIWLQGILYQLFSWEVEPSLSKGYAKRIENLRKLTERAASFGIGVYLYLNEPRCLPLSFFEKHPELKGSEQNENATLCSSLPVAKDLLQKGCTHLFENVPELAGVFTITMSENPTNCHSHDYALQCPRCSTRPVSEVVAEVNRIIGDSIHAVKPKARVIAWNWGWTEELTKEIIATLPENIEFMSTSENLMPINVGGINVEVHDYTMSQLSPGPRALKEWENARKKDIKSIAKVQLNNTWEFSAAPYIPVLDQVNDYLSRLNKANVSGLMLSWTLGGYPSLNLDLAERNYWSSNLESEKNLNKLAIDNFGKNKAPYIRQAWHIFSEAFKEFPFSIAVAYRGPVNYGPMNLLYLKPTDYKATMVGFPYDDLEIWREPYPEEVFESQFKKLTESWLSGLKILEQNRESMSGKYKKNYMEMENYALAAYCHFRSAYLQIRFIRLRNKLLAKQDSMHLKKNLKNVVQEDIFIAKKLHKLVLFDSKIGFEASNHYYYTVHDLREKVLNCEYILQKLNA